MDNSKVRNRYENDTIDLLELARACLAKWWLILAVMAVLAIICGGYCKFFVPHAYRAETQIYITNSDSVISVQDLQISNALTEDYETIIKSRHVLNKVIDNLGMTVGYGALRGMVSVTNPNDTHILTIAVTTRNKSDAVIIANEVMQVSVEEIYKIIGTNEPSIIDEANEMYVVDTKASWKKYALLGALIGFVLVAGVIVIRTLMDTTIKNEDDIEKYLGIPVLAAVPMDKTDLSGHSKKTSKKGGAA